MRRTRFLVVLGLLLLLVSAGSLFAQGVQTATLEGTVLSSDGTPLPGVTVSLKSPVLMGTRTAVTSGTGDFVLPGLPPGKYTITYSLEGMQTISKQMSLALGIPTRDEVRLKVSNVSESITVTASAPTVLENSTVGINVKSETVNQLPVLRTPTDIASLSPGVTGDRGGRATTPVGGQLSINGGMAYDNNFLINGVNMQDNIFGNTNNLFVEDAIQETQVLTSGISAEYGHFTGGVLNVITKSGGNVFSGSFRDDLTKPSWTALTPYEQGFRGNDVGPAAAAPHTGNLSNVYEATLGGPIIRDHLWFFLAGRKEQTQSPSNLPVTGTALNITTSNKRPEGKLTATIGSGQTLQADYLNNPVRRDNEIQVNPMDTDAVAHNSLRPNSGYTGYYSGVFSSSVFAEARYSKKHFGFRNTGGTLTDIFHSPIRSNGTRFPGTTSGTFNAPYFDSTDPEDRNNKQQFAAVSYFLSRPKLGSHEIKGGFERFVDERTGGNSQTATNYTFYTNYKNTGGVPALDANGQLIPLWLPATASSGAQYSRMAFWLATRGAKLDVTTNSFFVNDRWNLNSHWAFNLGGRYEKVSSKATGGIIPIDTSSAVPRLGASFDPGGDGKYKFDVTYAQYAGRYNPALTGANTAVGHPAYIYGYYVGPAGQGRDFAPGFDPNNYVIYTAGVPTANIFVQKGMHSPIANEWTVSGGMALPKSGWTKLTLTDRKYTDFIEDFILIQNGCTNIVLNGINAGCQDNITYANSNGPKRHYQASELQAHYDVTRAWSLEGNWTHQFKNDGNYEGESGQSIAPSAFGNRPEMQDPREIPTGHLAQYEEDRARLWTTYTFDLHRAGNLSAGFLYRYDSPITFSYTASVARSATSKALNPGYKSAGNTVTLFFGNRGAGQFNSTSLFDASVQYSLPITRVTPWIKFDVRNMFNRDTLIRSNISITADANSPKDAFGYPTGYVKSAAFVAQRPTGNTDYISPRQYLVFAGIRF